MCVLALRFPRWWLEKHFEEVGPGARQLQSEECDHTKAHEMEWKLLAQCCSVLRSVIGLGFIGLLSLDPSYHVAKFDRFCPFGNLLKHKLFT